MAVAAHSPRLECAGWSTRAALRILWLTTSADTDGPGRALLAVVNRWRRDDTVAVCAVRRVGAAFRNECRTAVETHTIGMRGGWDVVGLARLVLFCRRWRPDVIHTQLSRADWIGRPLGRALGVPVVSTIHNVHSRMYRAEFTPLVARVGLACDRLSARFASRIVAVSSGVHRDLEAHGVPPDRIILIHNGLNLDGRATPLPREVVRRSWHAAPDDIVVGTVALFKAQKGLSFLVEAARIAIAANPRVRFVHMGDGPLREAVSRQIAAAGLGDRFLLLDRVPDPMTLLSGLDVFALPSMWEGLPVALLEAMSAALPSVGTAVSGIEEVIEHNRSGLLVPPADPGALADAILHLAADPLARRTLGEAAAKRVACFASDLIASQYWQATLQVLEQDGTGAVTPIDPPSVRKASNI
jgi:glycosyltransferase involved in cell wall biosynthesis